MQIHHYDPVTRRKGKSEHINDANPVPANATTIAPPEHIDGKYIIFVDGGWGHEDIPQQTAEELLQEEREAMALTRYQAFEQLRIEGLLKAVKAIEDDPDTPEDIRLMLKEKTHFRRMHPVTIQMLDAIGVTDDSEKDRMFREGALIDA